MGYIDAGYSLALVVLAVYGASLWFRRRRLEQLAVSVGLYEGVTAGGLSGSSGTSTAATSSSPPSSSSPPAAPIVDDASSSSSSGAAFGDEG